MGEELTIEAKALAVAEEYTKQVKAREIYATLADAGDEDERRKLEKTDRILDRLKAEDRRLEAERRGSEAGDPATEEAARYRRALDHTRRIEDGFDRDLARMGWYQQPSPSVRREIEETALAGVRDLHGEHATEHCRGVLDGLWAARGGTTVRPTIIAHPDWVPVPVKPEPSAPFLP